MIRVPGDKSISHRALLLSVLAEGESRLQGVLSGADCRSTASALRAMGAEIPALPEDGGELRIRGVGLQGLRSPQGVLDCGNSGTTARLLLGTLAGVPVDATLTGDASLRSRPMRRVTGPVGRMGASFQEEEEEGRLPIRVRGGGLEPLSYTSPVASAQVKSALLLAGLTGNVAVEVEEPARSRDHTERLFRRMGAEVTEGPGGGGAWRVALPSPPRSLRPLELQVPGDFSSAAFPLVWGLLRKGGGSLRILGVGLNPTRTGLLSVLEEMGARIRVENLREAGALSGEPMGDLVVEPSELTAARVGGARIPGLIDEIPALAVAAARARGVTEVTGAGELRVKESDRIGVLVRNLRAVGVEVEELEDGLRVHGREGPLEGAVEVHRDHRIAMAFGVLGALPGCRVEVDDPDAADVSFPGFWDLLEALARGGRGNGPGAVVGDEARMEGGGADEELPFVVTVDGPAGSGKSTTAREAARRLGLRHLDSGALYRALTLAILEAGVGEAEWDGLDDDRLQALDIRLRPEEDGFRVLLDGVDPGDRLRSTRVTERVSRLAGIPAVRRRLLALQREAARGGGVVADGRDMGTVVFPDARVKVYLTASLEERARRRLLQEGRAADPVTLRKEARRIQDRDRSDETRATAPLRRPEDAVVLDTTKLNFEEQVGRIVEIAERARQGRVGRPKPLPGTGWG